MNFRHPIVLLSSIKQIKRRKISTFIDVSKSVQNALNEKKPIVALESTIISHGMPYPSNMDTALEVEEIVRANGAEPATIAIIEGRIKVGLNQDNLISLASRDPEVYKCSRRDLPYVIGNRKTGGTTVAGTMIIANKVGLKIFATGGIGGVHRYGQDTLDISADLIELGRTPVVVVCSGVKSILDIPRTLEFLETQGVCVATYGDAEGHFPDFYTRDSGCKVPYNVPTPTEAAKLIATLYELGLESGLLIAVPIPEAYALKKDQISAAIEVAYMEAAKAGVTGKDVTPFLLDAIANITQGNSLAANIALIKNNATVAAQIAKQFYEPVEIKSAIKIQPKSNIREKPAPFVVGASILDLSLTLKNEFPPSLNGATYAAQTKQSPGGVGRNIAEGILKLHGNVNFLSAVGDDELGNSLLNLMPAGLRKQIVVVQNESTSLCSLIFDKLGDCKLILGNMEIHQRITPDLVLRNEEIFAKAPLIVFDGNLSMKTMECVLHLAERHRRPVFFEPTDMLIAGKPFVLPMYLTSTIKIISPNLFELKQMAETLTGKSINYKFSMNNETAVVLEYSKRILRTIEGFFDCIILTLGHHGVVVSIKSQWERSPLFDSVTGTYCVDNENFTSGDDKHSVMFYKATPVKNITNVSGAGDSFSSGFITGLLRGFYVEKCVVLGFLAAERALQSTSAVPKSYFNETDDDLTAIELAQTKLKVLKI